jgi:membrane protein YdbS with pleckstrin-like domain
MVRTPQRPVTPPSINRYLLPTEQSIVTLRQHPAALITSVAVALAGLAAAFSYNAMHSRGSSDLVLVAVWIAWLLLALRVAFRIARWYVDYFSISSLRILLTTGLAFRTVSMIPLGRVNDISLRRSFFGRLLGYGELVVQHGRREQTPQRFQYIPYPEQLYVLIRDLFAPPTEELCPTCDGRGTVFRHRGAGASPEASAAGYRSAGLTGSGVRKLLRRGYLEVVCPTCAGRKTVSDTTELDDPDGE